MRLIVHYNSKRNKSESTVQNKEKILDSNKKIWIKKKIILNSFAKFNRSFFIYTVRSKSLFRIFRGYVFDL